MSDLPEEFQNMRSGAMPDESIQAMSEGYDGLYPGQAAKIAEKILSEPEQGHDGASGDGWDMKRDAAKLKDGEQTNDHSPWRGLDSVDR
jgi:hypothetical protein